MLAELLGTECPPDRHQSNPRRRRAERAGTTPTRRPGQPKRKDGWPRTTVAVLGAFAEIVRASGNGQVADLGCGPGHITAYLDELGLAAFGIDASPVMIKLARQAYPGLRFDVGTMAALSIVDGRLGGVLSRWSIIHTPPEDLPVILTEFHRVLAPGGHLLVGFSASDDPSHLTQIFDHKVTPAYRWWPDHLADLLRESGLAEVSRMVSQPQSTDPRQFQGVQLLARKN